MATRNRNKQEAAPERAVLVTIRSGRKNRTLASWQYFSIIDTLRDMGAGRQTALDTAKWCGRTAQPGDTREIEINSSEKITLEAKIE